VHRAGDVVLLEYEVRGTVAGSKADYPNRFASIVYAADRKITHWRDYMDSLAAWNALRAEG
jgi:ketosteroid isomerase-like protein